VVLKRRRKEMQYHPWLVNLHVRTLKLSKSTASVVWIVVERRRRRHNPSERIRYTLFYRPSREET
jgi:hypothetical protein